MAEGYDEANKDLAPEIIEEESNNIDDYSHIIEKRQNVAESSLNVKKTLELPLTPSQELKLIEQEARKEFALLWTEDVENHLRDRESSLSFLDTEQIPIMLDKVDEAKSARVSPISSSKKNRPKKKKAGNDKTKFSTLRENSKKQESEFGDAKKAKIRRWNSFDENLLRRKEDDRKKLNFSQKKKAKHKKTVSWKEGTLFPSRENIIADLLKFAQLPFVEKLDDQKTEGVQFEKVNGKDVLIGGTIEKLVSRLADAGVPDGDYIKEFLFSYRILIGPMKLMAMLIDRFNLTTPETASSEDVDFKNKFSGAMKLRVINVMKKWLTSHYYDFLEEKRLFNRLNRFIEEDVSKFGARWADQLRLIIQQRHNIPYQLKPNSSLELIEVTMRRPDSGLPFKRLNFKKEYFNMCFWGYDFEAWLALKMEVSPTIAVEIANRMLNDNVITVLDPKEKGEFKKDKIYKLPNKPVVTTPKANAPNVIPDGPLKFTDIDPLECSRQLTLIMQDIFLRVTARELFEIVRVKDAKGYLSPWTDLMLKRMDTLANFVATELVTTVNVDARVELIKRFLKIATNCFKYNDFANAAAVVKGLQLPVVEGLTKTWQAVPRKYTKVLEDLKSDLSFNKMKERMKKTPLPLVPDINFYIQQLVEIGKMPDHLENNLVNFQKCRAQAALFEEIERSRGGAKLYFKPIQRYIDYLNEEWIVLDEKEQSLNATKIEPKAVPLTSPATNRK